MAAHLGVVGPGGPAGLPGQYGPLDPIHPPGAAVRTPQPRMPGFVPPGMQPVMEEGVGSPAAAAEGVGNSGMRPEAAAGQQQPAAPRRLDQVGGFGNMEDMVFDSSRAIIKLKCPANRVMFTREDLLTSSRLFADAAGFSEDEVYQAGVLGNTGPYTLTVSKSVADAIMDDGILTICKSKEGEEDSEDFQVEMLDHMGRTRQNLQRYQEALGRRADERSRDAVKTTRLFIDLPATYSVLSMASRHMHVSRMKEVYASTMGGWVQHAVKINWGTALSTEMDHEFNTIQAYVRFPQDTALEGLPWSEIRLVDDGKCDTFLEARMAKADRDAMGLTACCLRTRAVCDAAKVSERCSFRDAAFELRRGTRRAPSTYRVGDKDAARAAVKRARQLAGNTTMERVKEKQAKVVCAAWDAGTCRRVRLRLDGERSGKCARWHGGESDADVLTATKLRMCGVAPEDHGVQAVSGRPTFPWPLSACPYDHSEGSLPEASPPTPGAGII